MAAGTPAPNEYKNETPPADVVFPEVEQVAHAADLGLTFYTGDMFPEKYQGRDLLDPARLVEPHRAGRRARHGHVPEGRRPRRRTVRFRSPKAGTTTATISAVRSMSRSIGTARCWSRTISSARSIASGTTASNRSKMLRMDGCGASRGRPFVIDFLFLAFPVQRSRCSSVPRAFAGGAALVAWFALCVVCPQSQADAGDVKAGRAKADKCAVCHGFDGLSEDRRGAQSRGTKRALSD